MSARAEVAGGLSRTRSNHLLSRSALRHDVPVPRGLYRRPRQLQPLAAQPVAAWDVVVVATEDNNILLGRVIEVEPGNVAVVDVLRREAAAEEEVWVATSLQRRVEQEAVLAVLEYDYSQRIDPDRVANPHGEHAEELFTLCGRDALRGYAGGGRLLSDPYRRERTP